MLNILKSSYFAILYSENDTDYIAVVNRVSRHMLSLNISRKIYVVASHFKTKQNKTIKHMLWCATLLMRTTTYVFVAK